jgi:hypothetical protein
MLIIATHRRLKRENIQKKRRERDNIDLYMNKPKNKGLFLV